MITIIIRHLSVVEMAVYLQSYKQTVRSLESCPELSKLCDAEANIIIVLEGLCDV